MDWTGHRNTRWVITFLKCYLTVVEYPKNYRTPVYPAHVSIFPFANVDLAYKRRLSVVAYFDV